MKRLPAHDSPKTLLPENDSSDSENQSDVYVQQHDDSKVNDQSNGNDNEGQVVLNDVQNNGNDDKQVQNNENDDGHVVLNAVQNNKNDDGQDVLNASKTMRIVMVCMMSPCNRRQQMKKVCMFY